MFHKVISSFRLEADSLPGLLPITKVNKRSCRKLLAIKYMLTLAHVCTLGIVSKTFQPLFISSVVLKKTRQDSASTAKCQPLRACVAVTLCISPQWLYWKTKTKTELRRAYVKYPSAKNVGSVFTFQRFIAHRNPTFEHRLTFLG